MPIEQLQPDLKLAAALFDSLSRATRHGRGIVRDSYGAGEQAAHDLMHGAAGKMGLDVSIDAIGNLMMTLPGRDRLAPRRLLGAWQCAESFTCQADRANRRAREPSARAGKQDRHHS